MMAYSAIVAILAAVTVLRGRPVPGGWAQTDPEWSAVLDDGSFGPSAEVSRLEGWGRQT
jgi:hypothetical protein